MANWPTESQWRAMCGRVLGIPYEYGGEDTDGTDCTGLIQLVLRGPGFNYAAAPRDSTATLKERLSGKAPRTMSQGIGVFINNQNGIDFEGSKHAGLVLPCMEADGTVGVRYLHASSSRGVVLDKTMTGKVWVFPIQTAYPALKAGAAQEVTDGGDDRP